METCAVEAAKLPTVVKTVTKQVAVANLGIPTDQSVEQVWTQWVNRPPMEDVDSRVMRTTGFGA